MPHQNDTSCAPFTINIKDPVRDENAFAEKLHARCLADPPGRYARYDLDLLDPRSLAGSIDLYPGNNPDRQVDMTHEAICRCMANAGRIPGPSRRERAEHEQRAAEILAAMQSEILRQGIFRAAQCHDQLEQFILLVRNALEYLGTLQAQWLAAKERRFWATLKSRAPASRIVKNAEEDAKAGGYKPAYTETGNYKMLHIPESLRLDVTIVHMGLDNAKVALVDTFDDYGMEELAEIASRGFWFTDGKTAYIMWQGIAVLELDMTQVIRAAQHPEDKLLGFLPPLPTLKRFRVPRNIDEIPAMFGIAERFDNPRSRAALNFQKAMWGWMQKLILFNESTNENPLDLDPQGEHYWRMPVEEPRDSVHWAEFAIYLTLFQILHRDVYLNEKRLETFRMNVRQGAEKKEAWLAALWNENFPFYRSGLPLPETTEIAELQAWLYDRTQFELWLNGVKDAPLPPAIRFSSDLVASFADPSQFVGGPVGNLILKLARNKIVRSLLESAFDVAFSTLVDVHEMDTKSKYGGEEVTTDRIKDIVKDNAQKESTSKILKHIIK